MGRVFYVKVKRWGGGLRRSTSKTSLFKIVSINGIRFFVVV